MNAHKSILAVIFLISLGECFAKETVESIDGSSENLDSVMVDMCLFKDEEKSDEEAVWKLKAYHYRTFFSITIKENAGKFSGILFYHWNSPFGDFPGLLIIDKNCWGGVEASSRGWSRQVRCSGDSIHKIVPYEGISFNFSDKSYQLLPLLFKKTFPVSWSYYFHVDKQGQKIEGKSRIYVSGFCTDEQLEIVRRKEEESKR